MPGQIRWKIEMNNFDVEVVIRQRWSSGGRGYGEWRPALYLRQLTTPLVDIRLNCWNFTDSNR